MENYKLNLPVLMVVLMILMIPADTAKRGNDHDRKIKHQRRVRHHTDGIDSTTTKLEETRKKQSHSLDKHAPEYHNYYVSADMQYRGTYRECPPFQKLKCRGSKCLYQSCDKLNKWQKDCSFTPIEQCDSKDWLCDCSNELGYYRLNSSTTECVHRDDILCKNAYEITNECPEGEEKVCPSSDCHEKAPTYTFGLLNPKPTCSNDTEKVKTCEKPIECHCKYPLVRKNKCLKIQDICVSKNDRMGDVVCPDDCQVKECVNRNPTTDFLCPKQFKDHELYYCKKPLKCFCFDNLDFFITSSLIGCASENLCDDHYKIDDKGEYPVKWDYPYSI